MNVKRLSYLFIAAALCGLMLAGCGEAKVKSVKKIAQETSADGTKKPEADLSIVQTDIGQLSVPENVQVVGLGEASHGVGEYHLMKGEVFKALVEHNGCRSFVIEGDFGGALKVEDYIHGGSGTAKEAVREIGFAIYDTQELVELVEWMRAYNEKNKDETLHFYGMDMQRVDNNKEYLLGLLEQSAPALYETCRTALQELTDEARMEPEPDQEMIKKAQADIEELLKAMDAAEQEIVAIAGQTAFGRARQCANTLHEFTELSLCADNDYNTMRDQFMFEKVLWLMEHENGLLFINGHNGHIGRTSISGYTCLGQLLAGRLGEKYFAIGTDAGQTVFNSQDMDGNFTVREVSSENLLNGLLDGMDNDYYYVDFAAAAKDEGWQKISREKQKLITLNVGMTEGQLRSPMYYTTSIVPEDTFDGMIVFRKVSPTTLLLTD